MPPYAFIASQRVDFTRTANKLDAMKSIGVPYMTADISQSADAARKQGVSIATDLHQVGVDVASDSDMVALIAYLQRLGKQPTKTTPPNVAINK